MPQVIPATLLGQFGVTVDPVYRGKGVGKSLARHALTAAYVASKIQASKYVVLDALDEQARAFWAKHFDFSVFPGTEFHMYKRMDAIGVEVEAAQIKVVEMESGSIAFFYSGEPTL